MKKTRILQAIRQGQVGGGETHVFDLSTHLDPERFEPIVLSFTEGEMVDKLRDKGIETHVIHTTKPFDPRVLAEVKKLMKEREIDIVHAHGTRAASNTLFAARSQRLPLFYTIHGWSFNDSQSKLVHFVRRSTERFITRRTHLNICVSQSNLDSGKRFIQGFEAEVVYNGVSLERFDLNGSYSFAEEIDKKPGELWIGFIARMTFQKNPVHLLKAFREAVEEQKNLRLVMIGGGELEQDVKNYIEEHHLGSSVKVLPFRKDIPNILNAIDIYCLPSLWEGLPIGVLEAMAMQKPVLASRVDGTTELVGPENGLLVGPTDLQELRHAILKMSSSREELVAMGKNGRSKIEKDFTLHKMVGHIEKLYQTYV